MPPIRHFKPHKPKSAVNMVDKNGHEQKNTCIVHPLQESADDQTISNDDKEAYDMLPLPNFKHAVIRLNKEKNIVHPQQEPADDDQTISNDDKVADDILLFRCPSCKKRFVMCEEVEEKTLTISDGKDHMNYSSRKRKRQSLSKDEIGKESTPCHSEDEMGKGTPSPSHQHKKANKEKMNKGDKIETIKTPSPFKPERPNRKQHSGADK